MPMPIILRETPGYVAVATLGALLASTYAVVATGADDGSKVTPLMQKDLPDLPGKEGIMLTVDFPPGHV